MVTSAITSQHHTGSASAQLCGRVSCSDQLIQTVSLPATMTSGSISYWYRITTAETSASCLDRLTVSIRTTAGGTISLIQTLCNTNKTNSWVEKTLVLPSTVLSRKGQSVQVAFLASGNTTNATTFDLDDVSLTVAGGGSAPRATSRDPAGPSTPMTRLEAWALRINAKAHRTALAHLEHGAIQMGR